MYTNNMELCSVVHSSVPENVGCQCTETGGIPTCSEGNGGDPVLLNAVLDPTQMGGFQSFPQWCLFNCRCWNEEVQAIYLAENAIDQQTTNTVPEADPDADAGGS